MPARMSLRPTRRLSGRLHAWLAGRLPARPVRRLPGRDDCLPDLQADYLDTSPLDLLLDLRVDCRIDLRDDSANDTLPNGLLEVNIYPRPFNSGATSWACSVGMQYIYPRPVNPAEDDR